MDTILNILVPIATALLGSYFTFQYIKRKEKRDDQKEAIDALRKVVSEVLPFVTQAELLGWEESEVNKIADQTTRNGYISTVARAMTYFNDGNHEILHLALSTTLYLVMGIDPEEASARALFTHGVMYGMRWGKVEAEITLQLKYLEREFGGK